MSSVVPTDQNANQRTINRINCRKRLVKRVKREVPLNNVSQTTLASDSDSDDSISKAVESVPLKVTCNKEHRTAKITNVVNNEHLLELSLLRLAQQEQQLELDESLAMSLQLQQEENRVAYVSAQFQVPKYTNKAFKPPPNGQGNSYTLSIYHL